MLQGVLLVAIGFTLAADNPAVKNEPVVVVEARKLLDAYCYNRNDALAEERYTNHEFEVTATITQVVKGYEPAGSDQKKAYEYYLKIEDKQIIFAFPLSARKELANLKLPEAVTIRGTCVGRMIAVESDNIPDRAEHCLLECVCLRDCQIVKPQDRAELFEQPDSVTAVDTVATPQRANTLEQFIKTHGRIYDTNRCLEVSRRMRDFLDALEPEEFRGVPIFGIWGSAGQMIRFWLPRAKDRVVERPQPVMVVDIGDATHHANIVKELVNTHGDSHETTRYLEASRRMWEFLDDLERGQTVVWTSDL
jgi:hypothetical protein